jgi:hypothetical protein
MAVRSFSTFEPKTMANGAYEYTFTFYKAAESVNLHAGEGLNFEDKVLAIAKPTSEVAFDDCAFVGKEWKRAFSVSIAGQQRPVCTADNRVFLTTFDYSRAHHLFEVSYTISQASELAEVEKIMGSLQVARHNR